MVKGHDILSRFSLQCPGNKRLIQHASLDKAEGRIVWQMLPVLFGLRNIECINLFMVLVTAFFNRGVTL